MASPANLRKSARTANLAASVAAVVVVVVVAVRKAPTHLKMVLHNLQMSKHPTMVRPRPQKHLSVTTRKRTPTNGAMNLLQPSVLYAPKQRATSKPSMKATQKAMTRALRSKAQTHQRPAATFLVTNLATNLATANVASVVVAVVVVVATKIATTTRPQAIPSPATTTVLASRRPKPHAKPLALTQGSRSRGQNSPGQFSQDQNSQGRNRNHRQRSSRSPNPSPHHALCTATSAAN